MIQKSCDGNGQRRICIFVLFAIKGPFGTNAIMHTIFWILYMQKGISKFGRGSFMSQADCLTVLT